MIDTKVPENNAKLYEFLFETELLAALSSNTLIDNYDVPDTRILKFDEINDRFYPIEGNEVPVEKALAESNPLAESKSASLTC
jgi:hypothetical protein